MCRNVAWGWSWMWLGLFIYSAEGGNRILRNVCTIPADYTASHEQAIHLLVVTRRTSNLTTDSTSEISLKTNSVSANSLTKQ